MEFPFLFIKSVIDPDEFSSRNKCSSPFICKFFSGVTVPIPTFPFQSITIFGVEALVSTENDILLPATTPFISAIIASDHELLLAVIDHCAFVSVSIKFIPGVVFLKIVVLRNVFIPHTS